MIDARFSGIYDAGDKTYVACYTEVTVGIAEKYLSELRARGYNVLREYGLGGNRYTLLSNGRDTKYVSFFPKSGEMRIFLDSDHRDYPLEPLSGGEKKYEPTLWQLEVDNKNSKANGGMSYIMRLPDGRFLIIDGGYATDDEINRIRDHLIKYTPDGEKPVIAGWFLTHLHWDHFGAYLKFVENYADDVVLEGMYYNFPATGSGLNFEAPKIGRYAKEWMKAKLYDKLHSGMTLDFGGVEVAVMCTHEDVYPGKPIDGNDTGVVFRISANGQRIMFLGDCRDGECNAMISRLGADELKCDIVQFSHHGYEGATVEMYDIIGAETVLWPMNIIGWQETGYKTIPQNVFKFWFNINSPTREANKFIREDDRVKKFIVSGAGEAELVLPYHPTGERLPDYEKIFEEFNEQT